jgi:eukaryotic-like serine/threonine-protein kinase
LVSWPVSLSAESPTLSMLGWCHGSAGYVFLWALASRLLRRPELLDVAAGAARSSLSGTGGATLCCGLAGRAYGMLAIYRETGESFWLDSARVLAGRAVAAQVSDDDHRYSLYKGNLGVAVLIADLAVPEWAAMPFFESEGWARAIARPLGTQWR